MEVGQQEKRAQREVPCLHFRIFRLQFLFSFSIQSAHLCSTDPGAEDLSGICKRMSEYALAPCLCVYEKHVERKGGGGGDWLHLDSGKQADHPLSPTAYRPADLEFQSITSPCGCPEQAV